MNNQDKNDIFVNLEEAKRYDVGIVGWWYATNYGSIITYYALSLVINKLGYTTVLIDRPEKECDLEGENVISRNFFKRHCNISESVKWEQVRLLNSLCDTFVVGSDQVWTSEATRNMKYMFFLEFADDNKRKIAYASSFGSLNFFNVDKEQEAQIQHYLNRFDRISIREDFGVKMVKERFGINADRTLDPVFLITQNDYDIISEESTVNTEGKYVLAYILDPTPDKENFIKIVSQKLGIGVKIILDGRKGTFCKNRDKFTIYDDKSICPDVKVEDWIKLFKDSEYILTDSHHGLTMAIIYNKNFICYANHFRGYERFNSLLSLLELTDRMVEKSEQVTDEMINTSVNYMKVNNKLELERTIEIEWLKRGIQSPKNKLPSIHMPDTINSKLDKELCTGCSACVNSCPVDAITLEPDECGYYRATVNYEKCIGCGTCLKVCPAVQLPQNNNFKEPELYEFIAADENVLYSSSSGGVFPLLAKETLKRNGVVVGAAWREDFSVEHIIIDSENDLYKCQKSKFLQSYMGDVFQRIKEKLDKSIFVLFSGCPCQVAGLKAFLKNDYENLILVDLLCGNAPSTSFFQKYIRDDFEEPLAAYEFRHKEQGWNWDCTTTTTTTTTGNVIVRRGEKQDSYQRVYHNHVMCPRHCEKCKYQNAPRFGDLTIGDFWGIGEKDKSIDIGKGVSAVLCNNEKGKEFFECIPHESVLIKKKAPLAWLGGNGFVNGGCNFASPKRDTFYEAVKTMPFSEAINYALKPNKGIYPERGLLNYNAKTAHFSFDTSVWEEHYINGVTVLITKQIREKAGKFITMPLDKMLRKGCSYILKMRFKVKSDSDIINFHVKDSGTRLFQVIYSHKISHLEDNWIETNKEFVPDSNIYDEFMIGSGQLYGEGRFLAIDYIDIIENYKG